MSQKDHVFYTFLLPILLTLLLLVTSALLGLVNIKNLLVASALFAIVGVAVFLAELLATRTSRVIERRDTYALISSLLLSHRTNDVGNFLTTDEVLALEASAEEVWIYAYDLGWEGENSKFSEMVHSNLGRGVNYRYIVPNNKQTEIRVNNLRHKHAHIRNVEQLIKYKCQPRDLKLLQFGITIYNPSILSTDTRSANNCIVVFFPHYASFGPKNDNPIFIAMRGHSTIEIQEGFIELWNEGQEIARTQRKKMI